MQRIREGADKGEEVRKLREDLDKLVEENRSLKDRMDKIEARNGSTTKKTAAGSSNGARVRPAARAKTAARSRNGASPARRTARRTARSRRG
jgi:hypothetical protein